MAAQSYNGSLDQARKQGKLNSDAAITRRVRAVAQKLIPQVAAFRKDALNWQWEVNVERSDELNAYCAPGGKIMFFTGIVERLKLSDDEIAAIMGHEMAHALREHGRERMSEAYAKQIGLQLFSAVTGGEYDQYLSLADQVATVAYSLPHSRKHESEADGIGLELVRPRRLRPARRHHALAEDGRRRWWPAAAVSLHPPVQRNAHPRDATR